MIRRVWIGSAVVAAGLAVLIAAAVASGLDASAPEPTVATDATVSERGVRWFADGSFGSLSLAALQTSALPAMPVAAMLALAEADRTGGMADDKALARALRRHGFLLPERIANAPELGSRDPNAALGRTRGLAAKGWSPLAVTVTNIGCAACHAGPVYDAEGKPDPSRAWAGSPNTSLNLEGYTLDLFGAMRTHADDPRLWPTMRALEPDMDWRERLLLRFYVLPMLRERVAELDATLGRAIPFSGGLPGATNGLDPLHRRIGVTDGSNVVKVSAFNSIPELEGRTLRSRLLNTGAYVPEGADPDRTITRAGVTDAHLDALGDVAAFFTVPSMGTEPEVALAHAHQTRDIMRWMLGHRAQPWPGPRDDAAAARGRTIYGQRCATCHGTYDDDLDDPSLISFPNWMGDVGTDPLRAELFTERTRRAIEATAFGPVIDVRDTGTYAAPPLTGLWTSAPYLHNGSVPTLHGLMNPSGRPARFAVGSHSLDMERVGIGPTMPGEPLGPPVLIDTSRPGLGNGGHEAPFDALSPNEKADLLEFLKRL